MDTNNPLNPASERNPFSNVIVDHFSNYNVPGLNMKNIDQYIVNSINNHWLSNLVPFKIWLHLKKLNISKLKVQKGQSYCLKNNMKILDPIWECYYTILLKTSLFRFFFCWCWQYSLVVAFAGFTIWKYFSYATACSTEFPLVLLIER